MMKHSNKTLLRSVLLPFCLFSFMLPLVAQTAPQADTAIKAMKDRLLSIEGELGSMPVNPENTGGLSNSDRFELLAEAGIICHDIQAQTSSPMAHKGFAFINEALSIKEAPRLRAYLGSLHLIEARDSNNVLKKITEVDRGLKEIDRALEQVQGNDRGSVSESDEILVRVVRVESSIGLPDMFNRLDSVTEDLNWLLRKWIESSEIFERHYPASRLLILKAMELDQRGNKAFADRYRQKAAELEGAR